jgi:hypothetical protein
MSAFRRTRLADSVRTNDVAVHDISSERLRWSSDDVSVRDEANELPVRYHRQMTEPFVAHHARRRCSGVGGLRRNDGPGHGRRDEHDYGLSVTLRSTRRRPE